MIYIIYSDVELDWCDSIHFHDLKWSTMLTSEKQIIVIYVN